MMELITHVVKEVPTIAIWIFLIFYGFKVIVAGSIYGVIRHATTKVTEVFKMKHENRAAEIERTQVITRYKDLTFDKDIDIKDLKIIVDLLSRQYSSDINDSHVKALARLVNKFDVWDHQLDDILVQLEQVLKEKV